jgi:phage terminase small subunit
MPKKAPTPDPDKPEPEPFDHDVYREMVAQDIWSRDRLDFDLTLEEQLFVRSYIIDRNPLAAVTRLGYLGTTSQLRAQAARMLAKSVVKEAIEFLAKQLMERLDVTAERVQRQIASVAFFDPREVMEFDNMGVKLLNSKFWREDQVAAIKSIKMGQNGIEMQMYDRLKANEMLAKQLGVQPEDNDLEDAFRIASVQAMDRIGTVLSRLLPGGRGVQQKLIAEDPQVIEHKPIP